jgi:REP element-mobilizing transposase RayT
MARLCLVFASQTFMPRPLFINHTDLPYHITARCINRDWFSLDKDFVWDVMTRHLYFLHIGFNIKIHAFVLMSNHFHMIARSPDANLSAAMRYFMLETSRELTFASDRINMTYGGRFHRSLLSNQHHYHHAYKYLYRNPVMAGMCTRVEDYKYSSLPGLLGERWLDVPIAEDHNWESLYSRAETLLWLNKSPHEEAIEAVRRALKKPTFTLPKVDSRASPLEDLAF